MTHCLLGVVLVCLLLVPTYCLLKDYRKYTGHRKFALRNFRNQAACDDLGLNEPIDDKLYNFVAFESSMRQSMRQVGNAEFTFRRPKSLQIPQQVTELLEDTDFTFDAESEDDKLFINSAISKLEDITGGSILLRRIETSEAFITS